MNIGDKVLCVGKFTIDPYEARHGLRVPQVGEIYTIRRFHNYSAPCLLVEEIVNPKLNYVEAFDEVGFFIVKFVKWNPEEEAISIMEERVLVKP